MRRILPGLEYSMAFGLKVEGREWPWRILLASYASAMLIIIKSATVTVASRSILRKRDGTIFRSKRWSRRFLMNNMARKWLHFIGHFFYCCKNQIYNFLTKPIMQKLVYL